MTDVFAIRTLHTRGILQELPAKRTTHNIIELLRNELVALLFVDFFLLLTNGTLTVETDIEGAAIF